MKYDDSYTQSSALFGSDPEPMLVRHWRGLDRVRPVLDLGAGQGRHALWLARQGIRVERWTAPGSLLFITAFSSEDDSCERLSQTLEQLGPRSFVTADGEPRTYLEPDQILTLFPDCTPVHHWEGLGPEHRHGDGDPERHHMIEAVLRR